MRATPRVPQPAVAITVIVIASLAGLAAALATPSLLAVAIDDMLVHRSSHVIELAAVLLAGTMSQVARSIAGATFTSSRTASLRRVYLRHVLALSLSPTAAYPAGDLASRLSGGADTAGGLPVAYLSICRSFLTSLGALCALFLIDYRLGLALVITLIPAPILVRQSLAGFAGIFERYQRVQGQIAGRLVDALAGIRTIRVFGTRDREAERVLAPLPELAAIGRASWAAQRRTAWRLGLLLPLAELAVVAVAGYLVSAGRLAPGELLAASGYTLLALGFVDQIDALIGLAVARAGASRLHEILGLPAPEPGRTPLPDGPGRVSLCDVHVTAGGRPVLNGISLDIDAGSTVAIVGRSGAGKTTLAMLIGALTVPDRGRVLLDGVPVGDIDPAALHQAVAYAFDRPALLGTTVADMIGYGLPSKDPGVISTAARLARASEFIARLPQGPYTPLSQAWMSGGQSQRLGLARAWARPARVFVLDDATSSLDTITEIGVTDSLLHAFAGRTRIIVAQRSALAASADRVVWLDEGTVRGFGSHRDLSADPDYLAVFSQQRVA
jgi:ATP-binding cassette, subfamily B, bacterial